MKARFLAVALLWAGAALAQAPDSGGGPGPGPRHESPAQRMERLATLLDLTDAQKPQVQAVLDAEHAKMKAAHDEAEASGQKPTFEQMKATHEQVQQDTIAKLTPILSPAQLKKFQVLMEEHGPPGGHRPH
jgi:Spy/CpxP family protein refolding chaperone